MTAKAKNSMIGILFVWAALATHMAYRDHGAAFNVGWQTARAERCERSLQNRKAIGQLMHASDSMSQLEFELQMDDILAGRHL